MTVIIIDYGAGNLKSIINILETLGADYLVTDDPQDILNAERIIFPGQGHFAQAMQKLNEKNLTDVIRNAANSGVPFLGVCLGLQILFEKSEEAPGIDGLCILKGAVKRFTQGKIPQIGWNKLVTTQNNSILTDDYYYFVNSYYVEPEDCSIVSAYCDYYGEFAASVECNNIVAVQFHPEKSGIVGQKTFEKWLKYKN